jgi:hypothetical protein
VETYIQLERRFARYVADSDRDSLGIYASSDLYAPIGWKDILRHRCTVVVGASGTGKSREFRQQVVALRWQGRAAFFCRLDDLANLPLASVLEESTQEELSAWLRGIDEGWFFLDAIDEAKLVNVRHFELAIRKFLEVIAPHLARVHIVISTRPHAWEAYGDLAMLCEKLRLRVLEPGEDENSLSNDDDAARAPSVDMASSQNTGDVPNPSPARQEVLHVVTLAPLSTAHVRTFARALGVDDLEAFMDEVERANADLYISRPADLPGIVDIWRRTKTIGSYSDVVLQNIAIKLKELNPRHLQVATLTPERALRGAERLAAAATFSRRSSFLLPDRSPLDAKVKDELLDPRDVLLDWRPAEVQELLGRGLFDESLYGSVRFHHRTAREYLAARWLRRLLGQRKHRRSVKELLFARPYGTENLVVVPSLKPVVGWLALWDQDIRDAVLRVDPKLLLEHGDASRLPPDIRATMLRGFAARYATQIQTPLRLDLRELRRLADDRLLPTIVELLDQHRAHEDIRDLLLRLIRVGKLRNAGPIALSYALDNAMDPYSQVTAIQIVGLVGSDDDKRRLKDTLLAAPISDRALLSALIKVLYPSQLQMSEIPALLVAAQHGRDSAYDSLHQATLTIIEAAQDDAERLGLLGSLVTLLETPPFLTDLCRVSTTYAWLLPSMMAAAKICVANNPLGPFDPSVAAAVYMGAQANNLRIYTGDVHKDAIALLSSNRAVKEAVFWYAVEQHRAARARDPDQIVWRATLALPPMDAEDVPRLLAAMTDRPLPDYQQVALASLVNVYAHANRPAELMQRIQSGVAGSTHLETALHRHLNPPPPTAEQQSLNDQMRERDEQHAAELARQARRREEGIGWLRANVATLTIGDYAREGRVLGNIRYLHHELAKLDKVSGSRWTLPRWRLLERDFGPEVARAYRDYCVAYWRMYPPSCTPTRAATRNPRHGQSSSASMASPSKPQRTLPGRPTLPARKPHLRRATPSWSSTSCHRGFLACSRRTPQASKRSFCVRWRGS